MELGAVWEQLVSEDTAERALRRSLARRMAAAMAELPEKNRLALLMHLQGSTYREIAAFAGVPESTVVGRLHRARLRVRATLAGEVREELTEMVKNRLIEEVLNTLTETGEFEKAVEEIVKGNIDPYTACDNLVLPKLDLSVS